VPLWLAESALDVAFPGPGTTTTVLFNKPLVGNTAVTDVSTGGGRRFVPEGGRIETAEEETMAMVPLSVAPKKDVTMEGTGSVAGSLTTVVLKTVTVEMSLPGVEVGTAGAGFSE
jgi:hypothetical protein